jgi:O-antigen/teichoic acid export membrane protein
MAADPGPSTALPAFKPGDLRPGSPSVAGSLAFATADRLIRIAVSFFVGIAVLRHLGPASSAQLVSIVATAGVISTISKLGLDQIAMREAANPQADSASAIARFMLLRVGSSLLAILVLVVFADRIFPGQPAVVTQLAAVIVFVQTVDLGLIWCQALKLIRFASTASIAAALVSGAVRLVLVALDADYIAFLVFATVELLVGFVIFNVKALSARPRGGARRGSFTTPAEVGYSFATSVVIAGFFSFDAVALPRLVPLDDAGRYLAAKSLVDQVFGIGAGLTVTLFPFLVAARRRGRQELSRLFDASLSVAMFVGVGLTIALVAGYFLVVGPLLGPRFHGTGAAVVYLSLGMALFLQGGIIDSRFAIENQTGVIFTKTLSALLLKAALVFAFSQHLTPGTIAASTIVSAYGASLAITYFAARDVFQAQVRSLDPRRVLPAIRTVLRLR